MNIKHYMAKGVVRYKGDWVIIEAPFSVVDYYRSWVEKFTGKKITTSYHDAHVTVIAGKYDKVSKHPAWGKYDGQSVDFKYFSDIKTDHDWFYKGQYFWLPVECDLIPVLRTELGLKPMPYHPPHLTVGFRGY